MKKVLFCAGLLGLMASCADQDLDGVAGNSDKAEGITFETAEADTRIQYDKDGNSWNPFWYAEQDRVSIWANGVNKGFPTTSSATYGRWNALSAKATYKATKSEAKAAFTSIDDTNMLTFINGSKDAKFFAVYPATTENMAATPADDTLRISNLFNGLETQNIKSAKGANPAMVMIAHATAKRANAYDAVGEKVALSFNYVTPILKFGTSGLDKTYQNAFGKLKEIQVSNTGYKDPSGDATKDIAAPALVYGNGATLQVDTLNWKSTIKPSATPSSSANEITVTLNGSAGLAWSDEALAPVVVAITDHSAFSATKPDTLKSMLVFENIDLADKGQNGDQDGRYLSSSLTPSSNFKAITFDLSKYPWLVTKNTTANTRTLFVNSGKLADIFTVDATGNIKWADTQTQATSTPDLVAPTEIETVVIKKGVVIANADFTKLNKMTNIKHLTIEDLPTVPANAFKDLSNLKTLRLLNTTTIANANAIASAAALDSIVMPEYKFEGEAINAAFLKKTSLRYLDMGAEVMNAGFPARGLSLEGFALLYEVKVKDGIKVGANAFKDCVLLEKVNGRVDIVGSYAFANCAKLTAINISSQDVLSGSFSGCTLLKTIKVNGGNFVPTSVGSYAFQNATKINVDLASATTIGANAFEGATALTGIKHTGETVNVLRVAAATINAEAFKGCTGIEYIYFVNATSVKNDILNGATVKEIKFGEKFSVATALTAGTFGTIADTKLFVVPGQEGVSGNILTTGTAGKFTFSQIIEERKR